MAARFLASSNEVTWGTLAIDQSKHREAGHRRSHTLQASRYEWVRMLVRRGEEARLSVSGTTDDAGTAIRALRNRINSADTTMKPARFARASTHSGR